MASIVKVLTTLMIIVILSTAVVIMLSYFDNPLGLKTYSVITNSMRPKIFQGSVIFVLPKDDYSVGDVITYKPSSGKLGAQEVESVTHRITEIREEDEVTNYYTKGDANPAQDITPTTDEEIVGRVFFTIPLLGYLVEFAKTELGLILMIIVPGVIIIYEEMKKIISAIKKKDNQEPQITIRSQA